MPKITTNPDRWQDLAAKTTGASRNKYTVRVRVEQICGAKANDMGGSRVRTIGLVRAKTLIGTKNLVYSMRRPCQLCCINPNSV
jgi:IS5 family transposase